LNLGRKGEEDENGDKPQVWEEDDGRRSWVSIEGLRSVKEHLELAHDSDA